MTHALTIHHSPFLTLSSPTLTPIYSHQVVPTSCKAHVCVAAAYNDLNTKEARLNAIPHLKKAFEIKPNYAGAHFMQGTIHRELGDKEKAATSFQAVIQHSSETEYKPDVLYLGLVNYGALLMHGGMKNIARHGTSKQQKLNAKRALLEAIVLEPTRYAPNANLAELHSGMGEWDLAVHRYKIAATHAEVQADLYNNYAIAIYKRAVTLNPKKQGMDVLDQVENLYHESIRLDGDYLNPRRNLGKIYYRKKMYQEALVEFQHCARLAPFDGRCWYDIALAAMRLEDWKTSVITFEQLFVEEEVGEGGGEEGFKVKRGMDMSDVKLAQALANYHTAKQQQERNRL